MSRTYYPFEPLLLLHRDTNVKILWKYFIFKPRKLSCIPNTLYLCWDFEANLNLSIKSSTRFVQVSQVGLELSFSYLVFTFCKLWLRSGHWCIAWNWREQIPKNTSFKQLMHPKKTCLDWRLLLLHKRTQFSLMLHGHTPWTETSHLAIGHPHAVAKSSASEGQCFPHFLTAFQSSPAVSNPRFCRAFDQWQLHTISSTCDKPPFCERAQALTLFLGNGSLKLTSLVFDSWVKDWCEASLFMLFSN